MIPFFISFVTSKRSIESINKAWEELKRRYPGEKHILDSIENLGQWQKWVDKHEDLPEEFRTLWNEKQRFIGIAPDKKEGENEEHKETESEKHARTYFGSSPGEQLLGRFIYLKGIERKTPEQEKEYKDVSEKLKEIENDLKKEADSTGRTPNILNAINQAREGKPNEQTQQPTLTVQRPAIQRPSQRRIRGRMSARGILQSPSNAARDIRRLLGIITKIPGMLWFIIAIIVLILLMFVLMLVFGLGGGGGDSTQSKQTSPSGIPSGLSINITPDKTQYSLGENIVYSITVTNNTSDLVNAKIDGNMPSDTEFIAATQGILPPINSTSFEWLITNLGAGQSYPLSLTIRPTKDDIRVTLTLSVDTAGLIPPVGIPVIDAGGTASVTGVGSVPTQDTCHGAYTLPAGKNFGDTSCELIDSSKPFDEEVDRQDHRNAYLWHLIAMRESGIVPSRGSTVTQGANSFNGNSESGHGAYGLFQMNPTGGENGGNPLDRGDVPWKQQINNAIQYNNTVIHGSFCYWQLIASQGGC